MIAVALDPAALPMAVAGRGAGALRRFHALQAGGARDLRLFTDQPADMGVAARPLPASRADLAGLGALWITGLPDETAAELAALARSERVLVNVEDRPALCDFHSVAEIRRGDLLLTVSTGGASPRLAARIRARLGQPNTAPNLEHDRLATAAPIAARPGAEQGSDVAALTDALLEAQRMAGVTLEPGDRLAGRRRPRRSRPAHAARRARIGRRPTSCCTTPWCRREILALAPQARLEPVGKRAGGRRTPQLRINQRLIDLARAGHRVVRLKGGDPLVFGRGGEEALALAAAGIRFRIVPGISAGIGGAAAAGIPVTHRGLAHSVAFVTGHDTSGELPDLDWTALARGADVLVLYMALRHIGAIAAHLRAAGRDAAEPVAFITEATTPRQRVAITTLADAEAHRRRHSAPCADADRRRPRRRRCGALLADARTPRPRRRKEERHAA